MKDRVYVTVEIEHHQISEVKAYWLEAKAREAERAWLKRIGIGPVDIIE